MHGGWSAGRDSGEGGAGGKMLVLVLVLIVEGCGWKVF